jgi:hypothetical protein
MAVATLAPSVAPWVAPWVRRSVAPWVALCVALTSPQTAAAQESFEPVVRNDAQRALVEQILAAQERDGPYAPDLAEPLTLLADLYREDGDPERAAAATERALQVVRVNNGLFSMEQLPLLREAMEYDFADGEGAVAPRLSRDLDLLIHHHPNDLRLVPLHRERGDRQVVQLGLLLAGKLPPSVSIRIDGLGGMFNGNPDAFGGEVAAPSRSMRARVMTLAAWHHYASAIQILVKNRVFDAAELPELEMSLVRLSYEHLRSYRDGRRSLIRQMSYSIENREPMLVQLDKLLRVADWDLEFTHHSLAVDTYEVAYGMLKQREVPQDAIEKIFAPAVPIVLPAFMPNPLATHEQGSTGYIDVEFEVHRFGSARAVTIVGASPSATDNDKDALIRIIRTANFRPRVTAGELARTAPVKLRYYLHASAPL